jgi:shikimate 5-dehydrogenase
LIDVRLEQRSKESVFAKRKWGSLVFDGYDMFVIQASHQWFTWCDLPVEKSRSLLKKYITYYIENQ